MTARNFIARHYNKMRGKAIVKRLKIKELFLLGMLAGFLLLSSIAVWADDDPAGSGAEDPAPKSALDKLKTECEAVREQQVQMILEKEDQLEKLKEEIFSKMKALNVPAVPQPGASQPAAGPFGPILPIDKRGAAGLGNLSELEAQKAAFQDERQKFFVEMNRQKESLRQLQSTLDGKTRQLEAERARFEQEKKTVVR